MKWSLLKLEKHRGQPLCFEEVLDLKQSLMTRDSSILDVCPAKVSGMLTVNPTEYILNYTAEVTITLPSSRSLKPVELPVTLNVNEIFMTEEQFIKEEDQTIKAEVLSLEKSMINLNESVEDNLLLAIPVQVLTKEEKEKQEMPKGEDWEVISEEQYWQNKQETNKVDPRLNKLSEFFSTSTTDEENKN